MCDSFLGVKTVNIACLNLAYIDSNSFGSILNVVLRIQIRLGQVLDDGQVDTKELGSHQGRVYKLAVEPGSPHIIYSCGGDGLVQHVCRIS